jgi:hypothetical protein
MINFLSKSSLFIYKAVSQLRSPPAESVADNVCSVSDINMNDTLKKTCKRKTKNYHFLYKINVVYTDLEVIREFKFFIVKANRERLKSGLFFPLK